MITIKDHGKAMNRLAELDRKNHTMHMCILDTDKGDVYCVVLYHTKPRDERWSIRDVMTKPVMNQLNKMDVYAELAVDAELWNNFSAYCEPDVEMGMMHRLFVMNELGEVIINIGPHARFALPDSQL